MMDLRLVNFKRLSCFLSQNIKIKIWTLLSGTCIIPNTNASLATEQNHLAAIYHRLHTVCRDSTAVPSLHNLFPRLLSFSPFTSRCSAVITTIPIFHFLFPSSPGWIVWTAKIPPIIPQNGRLIRFQEIAVANLYQRSSSAGFPFFLRVPFFKCHVSAQERFNRETTQLRNHSSVERFGLMPKLGMRSSFHSNTMIVALLAL